MVMTQLGKMLQSSLNADSSLPAGQTARHSDMRAVICKKRRAPGLHAGSADNVDSGRRNLLILSYEIVQCRIQKF
jgi:hypothetical protein